jgi:alanine racemase
VVLRKSTKENSLSWINISTDNLSANIDNFSKISDNKQIIAVIKSNAYGHDMLQIAEFLDNNKQVTYFATADLDEALALRYMSIVKPIVVLSIYDLANTDKLKAAITKSIDLPIYNFDQIEVLTKLAKELNKTVNIHLKIDVGTHRLGWQKSQLNEVVDELQKSDLLKVVGVFSHFADSENEDQEFTKKQTEDFIEISNTLKSKLNLSFITHIACSASTMTGVASEIDAVRIGISMYGLLPNHFAYKAAQERFADFELKPILSWYTRIISIQSIRKDDFVGYAKGYKARKDMTIATLPIGYWDGYDRHLSNIAKIIIKNQLCNVVGKVCMNMVMVDVSNISEVEIGDKAILIGDSADNSVSADDLASSCGTINYEIVTRINSKIPRIFC